MHRRLVYAARPSILGHNGLITRSYASWSRHRPEDAFQAARTGEYPQFVDVREPEEHVKERLNGTLNVPLTQLKAASDARTPDTTEKLAYLDRSLPLYVHCDGGERAQEAATLFANLGFSDVRLLEGGVFEIARESGLVIERQ